MQLTSISSKYENEKEIVQPFKSQNLEDKPKEILTSNDHTLKDFKEVSALRFAHWTFFLMVENVSFQLNLNVVSKMENFWIRFKNVEIDCACLEEERACLKTENQLLKQKLKQYLQDISVANGRIGSMKEEDRLRPHSVKIERTICVASAPTPITKSRPRPVTGIEGNLSVAVRSKSLVQPKVRN